MNSKNEQDKSDNQTQINNIDIQIVDLIALRFAIVKEVAKAKRLEIANNQYIPQKIEAENKQNENHLVKYARQKQLKTKFARRLWRTLIHESNKVEAELIGPELLKIKLEQKLAKLQKKQRKQKKS